MKKILKSVIIFFIILIVVSLIAIYNIDNQKIDEKKLVKLCSSLVKRSLDSPNSFVLLRSNTTSEPATQQTIDEYKSELSDTFREIFEKDKDELYERRVFLTFEAKNIYSTVIERKAMCTYTEKRTYAGKHLSSLSSVLIGNKFFKESQSIEWMLLTSKSTLEQQEARVFKDPTFGDRINYLLD